MSNIHYYLADPEVRKASWQNRLSSPAWSAKPNPGHVALVELERQRKLHALITQTIDELHQLAGNSRELVVEVHGSMRRFMCWGCGMRGPMERVLERVRAGEEDPHCRDCAGILKSDTISFGQQLVPAVIDRAMQAAGEADLFLAVGTSLQVYPVAGAFDIARSAGPKPVILKRQPGRSAYSADRRAGAARSGGGGVSRGACWWSGKGRGAECPGGSHPPVGRRVGRCVPGPPAAARARRARRPLLQRRRRTARNAH